MLELPVVRGSIIGILSPKTERSFQKAECHVGSRQVCRAEFRVAGWLKCLKGHDRGTGKDIYGEGYQAVMGEMLTQGSSYSHVPARRTVWLRAMLPLLQARIAPRRMSSNQQYQSFCCQLVYERPVFKSMHALPWVTTHADDESCAGGLYPCILTALLYRRRWDWPQSATSHSCCRCCWSGFLLLMQKLACWLLRY